MKYPEITPFKTGHLKRGIHELYFEQSGNPEGEPIVFLHGGPGSGTKPWQRQFFNPDKYHIIMLDQRGCGQSKPLACLEDNTTQHLVEDVHALKEHLEFEKWHVFGGSWGSTLSLCYAHTYPDECLSVTVYGIFLSRECEIYDLYHEGGVASHVFADVFEEYISVLPESKRADPIQGFYEIFTSDDKALIREALRAWTKWELKISRLIVDDETVNEALKEADFVLTHSLIENHYFVNKGFFDGDELLKTIGDKLKNIPVHIVQGRYDMVCPFKTAYELHKAIPHAEFTIIPDAGHSSKEVNTCRQITSILDNL